MRSTHPILGDTVPIFKTQGIRYTPLRSEMRYVHTPTRVAAAIALSALLLVIFMQAQVNRRVSAWKAAQPERMMPLPHAAFLRHAVMGYHQVAADLLWLQAIQAIGGGKVVSDAEWIYRTLDLATDLDPQFVAAYQLGGIALSAKGKRLPLSNALLRKGMRHNPTVWRLPFYAGFNDYFYTQDYASAARHLSRAARLPGRPDFLPGFAARVYVKAGDPRLAIALLQAMIGETQDEEIRNDLIRRRDALLAGQGLP